MTEIQEAIEQRQVGLEVTMRDSISKMDTVQESALKHARLTNDTMVREVNRFELVVSTFEQFTKSSLSDLRKQVTSM